MLLDSSELAPYAIFRKTAWSWVNVPEETKYAKESEMPGIVRSESSFHSQLNKLELEAQRTRCIIDEAISLLMQMTAIIFHNVQIIPTITQMN